MTDISKHFNKLIEIDHQQMVGTSSMSSAQYQENFINQWWKAMLSVGVDDFTAVYEVKNALLTLGKKEQGALWQQNDALKQPLQRLMDDKHSGEKINDILHDLQQKIARLKPPKNNKGSLKTMFLLLFSWKQTAWQLWLENYHDLKKYIMASTKVLEAEKKQLLRYNTMLMDKEQKLAQHLKELESVLDLISLMVKKIQSRIDEEELSQVISEVLDNEFLPALQQRIIDLQQQLLIGRQTVMTINLIAQQNDTQANSINQALNTTSSALDVTAGLVIAEQGRQTLDKMNKKSTDDTKNGLTNAQQLKIVQDRIELALKQMDNTRKAYKKSTVDTEE